MIAAAEKHGVSPVASPRCVEPVADALSPAGREVPRVMGILNVTPDSFSDGGDYTDPATALAHARQMIASGAALIDVGGESTRPGAAPVSVQCELDRVMPVVEALVAEEIPVSIDTRRLPVMAAAVAAGVTLVNDVSALAALGACELVAASGVRCCLMHMRGQPATMQQAPHYDDVVTEVRDWLAQRLTWCQQAGIAKEQLLIDPGFGFGKTLQHNLALLRALDSFTALGVPVMVGVSRKSMLGALVNRPPKERVAAGVAAALLAAQQGVAWIRTHDVAATVDALKVLQATTDSKPMD